MHNRKKKTKHGLYRLLSFLLVAGLLLFTVNISGGQAFASTVGSDDSSVNQQENMGSIDPPAEVQENVGSSSENISGDEGTADPTAQEDPGASSVPSGDADAYEGSSGSTGAGALENDAIPSEDISGNEADTAPVAEAASVDDGASTEGLKVNVGDVFLVDEGGTETAVAKEWAYDESRNLKIEADFSGAAGDRTIIIEMPVGMVFKAGGYPTKDTDPSIISEDTYNACTMPANYEAAEKGGTLIYTIKPDVSKVSLSLPISYDERLWNKKNGGSVTGAPDKQEDGYEPPVKVIKKAGDDVVTKILSEVQTSTESGKIYTNSYYSDTVLKSMKPVGKEVSVGLHYIYNGRDAGKINSTPSMYWKKLTLQQEAPYKMDGDKKVYAEICKDGADVLPKLSKITIDDTSHMTTAVWENCGGFTYGQPSINGKYIFSSENFKDGDEIIYPQPLILAQGIYGAEYEYYKTKGNTKFILGKEEKLELSVVSSTKPFLNSRKTLDVVSYLTTFRLSNMGSADTGKKQFTYTFEGKKGVGITSLRLIMPKKEDCILAEGKNLVEVTYTVMDKDGNSVDNYSGKQYVTPAKDNSGKNVILSRDDEMVGNNYYFRTITYQVKTLRAGTSYFNNSSPFMSGGSIHGKLTGSEQKLQDGEACLTAGLEIKSAENDGTNPQTYTVNIFATTSSPVTTMGFKNSPLTPNTTIPAGGILPVKAQLYVSDYPYHSTMYVENPVFYLRLPSALSLVEGSLKTDREGVSPVRQTPQPEVQNGKETGYTLIPITFPTGDAAIGYFNEKLEYLEGKEYLTLSFELQASMETVSITQYDLRDLVCAGAADVSLDPNNSGWNPYNWSHNTETADSFSKGVYRATYSHNVTTNATFTVQAAAPMVKFSAEVKESNATDADYGKEMTFIDNTGNLDYRISFKNNTNGTVDGNKFYYIIQIPKKGEAMSGHISDTEISPLTFSLSGPVKLKSEYTDLYDVRYSFDKPGESANADFYNTGTANFEHAEGYAAYYTAAEVGAQNKWADVRCIKLVVKEDSSDLSNRVIPSGEECTITLQKIMWDVSGAKGDTLFNWSSCGLQRYDLQESSSEGHTPTNKVNFNIHPFKISSSATLTGVRDGNNTKGTTKKAEILIPAYLEAKELKIKSVKTEDMRLVESSVMESNIETTIPWGNENFALTASLDSGAPVDILTGSTTVIGTSSAQKVSTLTFTLKHANLMSTNTKAGIVTVVVGDDRGVEITEKINIRTIGTEMNPEDLTGTVMQGKNFTDIGNGGEQINITSDSAVSVQFNVQNYLNSSYGEPYIRGSLPSGSTLVLADITDSRQPEYYFYKCTENIDHIGLNQFSSMKNGISTFDSTKLPVDARLLFILDYAQASQTIQTKTEKNLTLIFPGKENDTVTEQSKQVNWTISPKRQYKINIQDKGSGISMASSGEMTLSGSLNSEQLLGNDTYHYSDYLTLSLSLSNASGVKVNFPPGTTITANGIKTGTAEDKALLSLGGVGANSIPFSIKLSTAGWGIDPGTYTLGVELYCSRAEGYISAVSLVPEAEEKITLTVASDPSYGLSVSQVDEKGRLVSPEDILEFKLDYEAETDAKFSAMLYEKAAGSYNKTVNWTTDPTFITGDSTGLTATLEIPGTVQKGATYRIVFKMESGDKVIEVPYNIIIQE